MICHLLMLRTHGSEFQPEGPITLSDNAIKNLVLKIFSLNEHIELLEQRLEHLSRSNRNINLTGFLV